MANRQTKAFRKRNPALGTKVIKGASVPKEGKSGVGESLSIYALDRTKGVNVDSHKEREASGKKPWKGCGDACGRNRDK